jgi:hypothetical protein
VDALITYDSLRAEIREGSTKHKSARTVTRLRAKIEDFRRGGGGRLADWLELLLAQEFTLLKIDELVERTKAFLAEEPVPVSAKLGALVLLAKLTMPTESYEENCVYRRQARKLAHSERRTGDEVVILVNWLAAAIEKEEADAAQDVANQIEDITSKLVPAVAEKVFGREARNRFQSHKGKILFMQALNCDDQARRTEFVTSAGELYRKAIEGELESDHGRTNLQIELAFKLTEQNLKHSQPPLSEAGGVLAEAERSLNSHHCDKCQGYYHQTRARYHLAVGNDVRRRSLTQAVAEWQTALRHVGPCRENYTRAGFTTAEVDPIASECEKNMADAALPRKVFLSHKSKDKHLVRDFKATLQALGLEPWLDEEAMAAGANLERSLLQGFKDSCAVVFFITPNYVDDGFLATEIDYAIKEKRAKGDKFAIIILDFPDAKGKSGDVPELLKQYVWKKPQSHLEALRELLKALPLGLGTPDWK